MRATSLVPLALLLGSNAIAQGKPTEITLLPLPVARSLDWSADDFAYVGRIVDALTGRPIAGASLCVVPERSRPTGGEFWFDWKWTADADGFVRVPANELRRGWFFVDAKGYGPISESSYPPGDDVITRLVPGVDFPVAVRDILDRPVANVELGACLGCGHTPDVRTASTNAQGLAVLACMQPTGNAPGYNILDIYPRGEGLAPDYQEMSWSLDEPPPVLRVEFAPPVRGRVLAPNGRPLRGVAVRADAGLHRGPWTATDAEGHFALLGNKATWISLYLDEREFLASLPSTGREIDLVLPAEAQRLDRGGGWTQPASEPASPTGTVVVTVNDAVSGAPLVGADVAVWRIGVRSPGDLENPSGVTDEQGRFTARIAAGDVALRVYGPVADGKGTPCTHDPENRDLVVKAGAELPVQVALQPRAAVTVRVAEGVRGVQLEERWGGGSIDSLVAAGKPVPVPAKAPFAFRIDAESEFGSRYVAFAAPPRAPVELRPFAPTRVQLRIVDANGKATRAVVELADVRGGSFTVDDANEPAAKPEPNTDEQGRCELTTEIAGVAFVTVQPVAPGHRTLRTRVRLPERADDARIDLGTLVLPALAAPRLRVLRADGSAAKGTLTLLRPGLQVGGPLAADGGWDGIAPSAGDRVEVAFEREESSETERPGAVRRVEVPLAVQLRGEGPWTVREGKGRVVFDVRDDFGLHLDDGVVVFEDRQFEISHQLEVAALPDRELEFFVGARGCGSARVRLTLAPDEQRRVEVVLARKQ